MSLYERYFTPEVDEEQDAKLASARLKRLAKLESMVKSEGWGEFRDRVDELIEQSEVQPGMNYQIGRREGLMWFRSLMRAMEKEVIHERQAES